MHRSALGTVPEGTVPESNVLAWSFDGLRIRAKGNRVVCMRIESAIRSRLSGKHGLRLEWVAIDGTEDIARLRE